MKKIVLLTAVISLFSCIGSNYEPVTTYDFLPESNIGFTIKSIKNESPSSKKIAYRMGNILEEKEYHRWSEEPHVMLKRYWSLGAKPSAKELKSAVLRVFEINLDKQAAVIVVDVISGETTHRLQSEQNIAGNDESSSVAAMKKALIEITEKISSIK